MSTESEKTIDDEHVRLRGWLARPGAYAEPTTRVETIETHISYVFLTDCSVYKLKKPVRFEFLDFSSPELRERACREEVRLNRRLAPQVYRGVRAVTRTTAGDFEFDGRGPIVDWVVEMQRLPAERMLDERLRSGTLGDEEVRRLAEFLAEFYVAASPLAVLPDDYTAHLRQHVRANRADLVAAELDASSAAAVRRVHTAQLRLICGEPELFCARIRDGRIVDGHGDLRPEHVALIDPPAVFDCLEFSAELRQIDVVDELCFLAMECERLGAPAVGECVLEAYRRRSGDQPPHAVVTFYKSYRACVRAKVAALRARQLAGKLRDEQLRFAASYLAAAERAWRGEPVRPLLFVVCGLMGTGKTTLARALCDELGLDLIRTDVVRRELLPSTGEKAAYGEGRYDDDARRRVYEEVLRRAAGKLGAGASVVLDAAFSRAEDRERALQVGRDAGADVQLVECCCSAEDSLARIRERLSQPTADASEARPELYAQQRDAWEPSPALAAAYRADPSRTTAEHVAGIIRRLPRLSAGGSA